MLFVTYLYTPQLFVDEYYVDGYEIAIDGYSETSING